MTKEEKFAEECVRDLLDKGKDGLIVNKYRWNDDLCQYELIKTNDVKRSKEVMKQKHTNQRKVMAEVVNKDGDVDLFF